MGPSNALHERVTLLWSPPCQLTPWGCTRTWGAVTTAGNGRQQGAGTTLEPEVGGAMGATQQQRSVER